MKKIYLFAAAAAAMTAAGGNAATLISAAVFGSSGTTIWATANAPNSNPQNYTLFLQNPALGNFLNPHDEQINYAVREGDNYAFLAGDGYAPGTTLNSDPSYRLVLNFDNGAVLTGNYLPGSPNAFLPDAAVTIGNTTLRLTEFSFTRSLADVVGRYQATPRTDDGDDYQGNFEFTQTTDLGGSGAVPEPASWALMLGGFGLIGAVVRRRRESVRVTYA
jgi:hypothetical protein